MDQKHIDNYNNHAKFLAEIGLAIVNGNKQILDINGIKEIISLYLLIPYITNQTLETPDSLCKIPHLDGQFIDNISLENLRNTISHSFVTVEEFKNDGTSHGKYLIFDDRILYDAKTHSNKGIHSECHSISIEVINSKMKELFKQIIDLQ